MKKFLAVLLAVSLCLSAMVVCVTAEAPVEGETGTIGVPVDFHVDDAGCLVSYTGDPVVGKLTIPSTGMSSTNEIVTITAIDNFMANLGTENPLYNVTEVVVPEGVKKMHETFLMNTKIEKVTLPTSLELLDTSTFNGSKALKAITYTGAAYQDGVCRLPDVAMQLNACVFQNNPEIVAVTYGTVHPVKNMIRFSPKYTINGSPFSLCKYLLNEIELDADCQFTTKPDSTDINYDFLESFDVVALIGTWTEANIAAVKASCTKYVVVNGTLLFATKPFADNYGGVAVDGSTITLLDDWNITELPAYAFKVNRSTQSATLNYILPYGLTTIGVQAYWENTSVNLISYGKTIDGVFKVAVAGCNDGGITGLVDNMTATLEDKTARYPDTLTTVDTVGIRFWVENITQYIPASVTTIGQQNWHTHHNSFIFSTAKESFGVNYNSFISNNNISDQTMRSIIGSDEMCLFVNWANKTAFSTKWSSNCSQEFTVPYGVEVLDHTFENSDRLTTVFLPSTLRKIDTSAFANCTVSAIATAGEEVITGTMEFPEGLETISAYSFQGDSSASTLIFPTSLVSIHPESFCAHNGAYTSVIFKGSNTQDTSTSQKTMGFQKTDALNENLQVSVPFGTNTMKAVKASTLASYTLQYTMPTDTAPIQYEGTGIMKDPIYKFNGETYTDATLPETANKADCLRQALRFGNTIEKTLNGAADDSTYTVKSCHILLCTENGLKHDFGTADMSVLQEKMIKENAGISGNYLKDKLSDNAQTALDTMSSFTYNIRVVNIDKNSTSKVIYARPYVEIEKKTDETTETIICYGDIVSDSVQSRFSRLTSSTATADQELAAAIREKYDTTWFPAA